MSKKIIAVVLCMVMVLSLAFAGCSSPAKKIVGTWVSDSIDANTNEPEICSFYEDGTCELGSNFGGNYGQESYYIDSDNNLKLTNFYGSTIGTLKYVELNDKEGQSNNPWWCIDGNTLYLNGRELTKQ